MSAALRKVVYAQLLFPMVLLLLGIYFGLVQVLARAGVIQGSSFFGIDYYQALTGHGVINAVVLTTFFAVALGNVVFPQFLKRPIAEGAAKLAAALMIVGTLVAAVPILAGKANVLYTFYPPLKAHPAFYIGVTLLVVGSWVAFWAWIPAYLAWRRENPGKKTPLAVVGMLATFIVWQIATLPVAYEVLVLLLPWSLGLVDSVNVVLARTLFWFFGHPLVYFWLLPAYLAYYVMLPKVAGGKLFSDGAARFAFLLFIVLSCPLGLHHQYADPGIASKWKMLHAVLTMLVAVPSFITAFSVAASLEHAGKSRGGTGLFQWWTKLPYLDPERWLFPYLFCGLVIFIFGGITGVVNASYNMNMVVHNSAWVPAHFHLTVAGPVFLAILGVTLLIVAGLGGKPVVGKALATAVPYLWTLGVLTMSAGQFVGGLLGQPRRTNMGTTYMNPESPIYRADWVASNVVSAMGGVAMTLAIVAYFIVLARTLWAPANAAEAERFELPSSEPLHDEHIPAFMNLRPWIVAAVLLCIAAYTPPLWDIAKSKNGGAKPYTGESPMPASR
jgi:cytochrome c oxidase subunit 1